MGFGLVATIIVLIAAFVAMIVFAKKQRYYPNAKFGVFASFIVVLFCCLSFLSETGVIGNPAEAIIKNELHYRGSVCYVLGKEIATNYPGKKVLVILRPLAKEGEMDRFTKAMRDSFDEAMEDSGCEITYDYLKIEQLDDEADEEDYYYYEDVVTGEQYNEVLDNNAGAQVVVSFTDLPYDPDEMASMNVWEMEPEERPALYLTFGDIEMLAGVIIEDMLKGLVIWKPGVKFSRETAPGDKQEAFDNRYVLVKKDNVSNFYSE